MAPQNPPRRRRPARFVLILVVSVVFICALSIFLIRQALIGERREPNAVLEGVEVGTFAELPGEDAFPESLTIGPDGNLYVGSFCTGEIWRITPNGQRSTFAPAGKIKSAVGMAFAPPTSAYAGWLYVADHGDCDPRRSVSRLKRISPDGTTVETVGNIKDEDIPNALAFDRDAVLYITDTQNSNIRYLNNRNEFVTWWDLPKEGDEDPRPTGLVYDPQNDRLIVADTQYGTIYALQFDPQREPLGEEILYQVEGSQLEGLALDDEGRLIVSFIGTNEIGRLESDGSVTILAENFREPSGVVYLDGKIYVTNFDGVSLAPIVNLILEPSLPFTVDFIALPPQEPTPPAASETTQE